MRGRSDGATALAKARGAWGTIPDWVEALAAACDARSQSAVAQRVGYSAATLSYVLGNKYQGDGRAVERAVRQALMRAELTCPVLGPIDGAACVAHQRLPFSPHNPQRVALYRTCRACPHSSLPQTEES